MPSRQAIQTVALASPLATPSDLVGVVAMSRGSSLLRFNVVYGWNDPVNFSGIAPAYTAGDGFAIDLWKIMYPFEQTDTASLWDSGLNMLPHFFAGQLNLLYLPAADDDTPITLDMLPTIAATLGDYSAGTRASYTVVQEGDDDNPMIIDVAIPPGKIICFDYPTGGRQDDYVRLSADISLIASGYNNPVWKQPFVTGGFDGVTAEVRDAGATLRLTSLDNGADTVAPSGVPMIVDPLPLVYSGAIELGTEPAKQRRQSQLIPYF